MTHNLVEGISLHEDAEGAIIQSNKLKNSKEITELLGMKNGKTQVVQVFDHTEKNEFTVVGSGDITVTTGVDQDAQLDLSGGVTAIKDFEIEEALATPSKWTYTGTNYPHAA